LDTLNPATAGEARGSTITARKTANRYYVADITCPIADGSNLYLATVIDCFSRRLVGWAVAEHMRTDLITDALRAARDAHGSITQPRFPATLRTGKSACSAST